MDGSAKVLTFPEILAGIMESREPRAESREPRAESREPRAESREPRAESREPRAESREPREEHGLRERSRKNGNNNRGFRGRLLPGSFLRAVCA